MFKKISREQNRLRMAIDGPTGSGKTYTALVFGLALAKSEGTRLALVDTEHNSASLYVGEAEGWDWDGVNLESFAPSTYTACLKAAAHQGYGVIIIDSLSHAWMGTGGALDQVDRQAGKKGGKFSGWREVTPQHNELIDTLRRYPGHVIVTLRSKMEYAMEEDARGRISVAKVGMRPVQREGVEYEFDIVADMDTSHRMTISKTRFSEIDGQIVHKPGPEWVDPILRWLTTGAPRKEEDLRVKKERDAVTGAVIAQRIKYHWRELGWSAGKLKAFLEKKGVERVEDLPLETGEKLLHRVEVLDVKEQAKEAF